MGTFTVVSAVVYMSSAKSCFFNFCKHRVSQFTLHCGRFVRSIWPIFNINVHATTSNVCANFGVDRRLKNICIYLLGSVQPSCRCCKRFDKMNIPSRGSVVSIKNSKQMQNTNSIKLNIFCCLT